MNEPADNNLSVPLFYWLSASFVAYSPLLYSQHFLRLFIGGADYG